MTCMPSFGCVFSMIVVSMKFICGMMTPGSAQRIQVLGSGRLIAPRCHKTLHAVAPGIIQVEDRSVSDNSETKFKVL